MKAFMVISLAACAALLLLGAFRQGGRTEADSARAVPAEILVPDTATMVRAWDFPRNPARDSVKGDKSFVEEVRLGFRLFTNTPRVAPGLAGGDMSCNQCHPNGGQREKFMPLVGIAGVFPEYNKRAGRMFSLEDRIIGCFRRSLNSDGARTPAARPLTPQSREVAAIAAYIGWLSQNVSHEQTLGWRGHNVIAKDRLIPIGRLDPRRGREIFLDRCSNCHGVNGQGVEIGDKKPGPLWGPRSWNDGAGAARTYTLAGIIRYAMPYLDPGSLSDEEAQQIAAYITAMPRPVYGGKKEDYLKEKIPEDAVYYKQIYQTNPLTKRLGGNRVKTNERSEDR